MDVDVDISEMVDLAADLAAAGQKAKMVSTVVLSEAADELRARAVADAPRDTGDLAASIYVTGSGDSRTVGSDLKQGFFQEYGTSRHPPQPWLFANSERAGTSIVEALEQIEPL